MKIAVHTFGSAVAVKSVSVPPATVRSAAVKPNGASLKVKVTFETLSATLSAVSTILTVTEGAVMSICMGSLAVAVLPAASVPLAVTV